MPKLITRPPKYTCHKASGQAVVKVGGKLRYLGPFNSPESKVRYQAGISEWAVEGENRPAIAATVKQSESDTILSELLAACIKYANDYYVKDGKHTSMVHLVRVIARLWKVSAAAWAGASGRGPVREGLMARGRNGERGGKVRREGVRGNAQ